MFGLQSFERDQVKPLDTIRKISKMTEIKEVCKMTELKEVSVIIKWSGREFLLNDLSDQDTVAVLRHEIFKATNVRPERQKLINLKHKGKWEMQWQKWLLDFWKSPSSPEFVINWWLGCEGNTFRACLHYEINMKLSSLPLFHRFFCSRQTSIR